MNYYLFRESDKSIFYDVCPYHYLLRKNSAATSNLNEHKLNDPIKVYKRLLEDTKNNDELYNIVLSRLAHTCVNGASRKKRNAVDFEKKHIKLCQNEIKSIKKNPSKKNFSRSLKIKILMCSYVPGIYGAIHRLYGKISGIDKKYEVR